MFMLIFVGVFLKCRVLIAVSLKVVALQVNDRYVQVVRIITYKYFCIFVFSKKLSSCKLENKCACVQQVGFLNVSMQLQTTKQIFKISESALAI